MEAHRTSAGSISGRSTVGRRRRRLAATTLLVFAVIAAACGGDDDHAAESGGETGAEATTAGAGDTTAVAGDTTAASAGQADRPGTATTVETARPADWDPEGELRVAYSGGSTTLDPAGTPLEVYLFPLYDRLTELADDYTVIPRLMTSWEYPDAHTMVMHLRDGVTFHDGTPFDATAVKANIERYRDLPTSTQRLAYDGVSAVEVVDPLTVRLTLSQGGTELPVLMSQAAGMMVSPKALAGPPEAIATTGVGGSGPYRLESFTPSEIAVYVPNEDHWNQAEGLLKKLTITSILPGQQRLNALKSGDADVTNIIGQDVANGKSELEAGTIQGIQVVTTANQNGLLLRTTLPPLDNPKIREAIAYAVDKQGIGEGLYSGTCVPENQFFLEDHWAHSDAVEAGAVPYDPERAQQLIAESGVTDLALEFDYHPVYQLPAEAIQSMLNSVGFTVTLVQNPQGTDFSFRDGKRQGQVGGLSRVFDPSDIVAKYALGGLKLLPDPDGEVAALAAQGADPSGDPASWAAAYDEIWQRLYLDHVVIPTCTPEQVWAHMGKVANIEDIRYMFAGIVDFSALYVAKG
jgi:peptide/nickel transport system substrate-binding protein